MGSNTPQLADFKCKILFNGQIMSRELNSGKEDFYVAVGDQTYIFLYKDQFESNKP